ncbi:MAG: CBS domain-containing protein [Candidatus Omnitrophica bacterium]|nr:CBS domain-containing protein [Candidatus Omnitrophota bacterium]
MTLVAKDIMMKKFAVISDSTDVQKACNALIKNQVSGLPVVNAEKKLVGFLSERDIIASACKCEVTRKKTKDIMIKKVMSVKETDPVENVSKIFTEKPFRYIPVTKNGYLIGLISRKQVINKLMGQYY